MNVTDYLVPVATAVTSIGAVSAFLAKYVSKVVKYVRLAADAINALENLVEALEDGALSAEEIDKVKENVERFKADLK